MKQIKEILQSKLQNYIINILRTLARDASPGLNPNVEKGFALQRKKPDILFTSDLDLDSLDPNIPPQTPFEDIEVAQIEESDQIKAVQELEQSLKELDNAMVPYKTDVEIASGSSTLADRFQKEYQVITTEFSSVENYDSSLQKPEATNQELTFQSSPIEQAIEQVPVQHPEIDSSESDSSRRPTIEYAAEYAEYAGKTVKQAIEYVMGDPETAKRQKEFESFLQGN